MENTSHSRRNELVILILSLASVALGLFNLYAWHDNKANLPPSLPILPPLASNLPLEKLEKPPEPPAPAPAPAPKPASRPYNGISWKPEVIVNVEGCEYVRDPDLLAQGREHYTHLGNCTNCWARMEKLLKTTPLVVSLPKDDSPNNHSITNFGKTFTHNGCEYAVCWGEKVSYTHIGSCTNCWAKMKAIIKEN